MSGTRGMLMLSLRESGNGGCFARAGVGVGILFYSLAWIVIPRLGLAPPERWTLGPQLALTGGVIAAGCTLAVLSERYFERPLRNWSRARARA
jgi:peptidoglycan/LPS O-acetylase OafA/YrhL